MHRAASPMTALSVTSRRSSCGRHPVLGEQPLRRVRQVGVQQAARGQVHRDRDGVPGVQPAAQLRQGQAEDPFGQPQDDAGALGHRDELTGRDEPLGRVLPAQQRLDALDPLAVQGVLGLVVEEELVGALERPAEVAEHREPPGRRSRAGRARRRRRRPCAPSPRTSRCRRSAAVPRCRCRATARARSRCWPRRRARHRRPRRGGAATRAAARRRPGLADAVHRGEQDGELVAAEPGDGVPLPQHRPEPRADLAEQLVAVAVAQSVVDLLEPVQVDQEHGDLALGAGGRGQRPGRAGRAAAPSWAARSGRRGWPGAGRGRRRRGSSSVCRCSRFDADAMNRKRTA